MRKIGVKRRLQRKRPPTISASDALAFPRDTGTDVDANILPFAGMATSCFPGARGIAPMELVPPLPRAGVPHQDGASSSRCYRETSSILRILKDRATTPQGGYIHAPALALWAEECSVQTSLASQRYIDLPPNTKSTIAIAFSHDGSMFASTHGDHTVKVFETISLREINVLVGHSRTPWTVKYHPSDASVLASGCLGHEVRVWNSHTGSCIAYMEVDGSVMSLAFHPDGDVLAIASGRRETALLGKLDLWEYKRSSQRSFNSPGSISGPDGEPQLPSSAPLQTTLLDHRYGLRCVRFSPAGDSLVVALANCNPFQATYPTYELALWSYDRNTPLSKQLPPRSLVGQAHLYSDGGLDVSPCGRHLITCAPPNALAGSAGENRAQLILVSFETGEVVKSAPLDNLFKDEHTAMARSGDHSPSAVAAADRLARRGPHPKGVTSVKFSPTQGLALLGYGVREEHAHERVLDMPHVVAAVFRLSDMSVISLFTSLTDDVNVARFVPFSGLGCIYGSKQGDICVISPGHHAQDSPARRARRRHR
uniref:Anaphase-promoting complex subunit 4 WD40 domain-containing protein n=1 Tax=Pinguiococcus pyrenoidosus TaxID=172671 RepID=A0A7R9YAF4_9STRA|mmetsp:Transcript_14588/g.55114  ORF Transcript_14588/g.55114 Transcript_14588/m.55114 type:complete len:539 (+) Transcript_14588:268-1884(+)